MSTQNWNSDKPTHISNITKSEVNRVLEVGILLRSVLSQQELAQIQELMIEHQQKSIQQTSSLKNNRIGEIGNTGVT